MWTYLPSHIPDMVLVFVCGGMCAIYQSTCLTTLHVSICLSYPLCLS